MAEPRSRSRQVRSRQALSGPVQGGSHTPRGRLWSMTSTSPSSACGPGTYGTRGPGRSSRRLAAFAWPRAHAVTLAGTERADTLACLIIVVQFDVGWTDR